jgi:hypothetical protein
VAPVEWDVVVVGQIVFVVVGSLHLVEQCYGVVVEFETNIEQLKNVCESWREHKQHMEYWYWTVGHEFEKVVGWHLLEQEIVEQVGIVEPE